MKRSKVKEEIKNPLYDRKSHHRQQADGFYLHKPRHIFHEKGVKDTLHPERSLYGNRSMIEHEILKDHRDDASRDSHRVKPNDRDTPPQFKKRAGLQSIESTADSMKQNVGSQRGRLSMQDLTDDGSKVKVNCFGNVIPSGISKAYPQHQVQNQDINIEDEFQNEDIYKGNEEVYKGNDVHNQPIQQNFPTRSDFIMGGKALSLSDGRPGLTYGKRQWKQLGQGYREEEPPMSNRKNMSRSFTNDNTQRQQWSAQKPARDSHYTPRQKLRNGIDVEQIRPTENIYKNHSLMYPVVNRQGDKSNVRNNPKHYCKTLNEEFVPEPLYENFTGNNNARDHMEIMTREEFADLQHFPRTRRKYFDNTMQPNRFIFRQDRAQTRDPYADSNRNTLFYGGKGDSYVMDPDAHPNGSANFYPKRQDDFAEGNDYTGLNNEVLYNKRVGEVRLPPHNDLKNFSRTRQAYHNQDYVRDRAANTHNANPHRRKVIVPKRQQYAPHAKEAGNPDLYSLTNKNADMEQNMPLINDPKNYDNVPEYNAQYNSAKKGIFTGIVNNREAWAKPMGNASGIKGVLNVGDSLYDSPDVQNNKVRIPNKNLFTNSINNREAYTKHTGNAKAIQCSLKGRGHSSHTAHKDNLNMSTPYMI